METDSRQRGGRRPTMYSPYVSDSGRRSPGAIRRALLVSVLLLLLIALIVAVTSRWSALHAEGSRDAASNPAPAISIPTITVTPTSAVFRTAAPVASSTASP